MTLELKELSQIPEELLTVSIDSLYRLFQGPTLLHLRGEKKPSLFISCLLHGNEHTGFLAVQKLLQKYSGVGKKLPRSLSIFFGNVEAASRGIRSLDHQSDFNRVWHESSTPKGKLAQQVIHIMKGLGLFASVDIHNNTGRNPHFGCISQYDWRHLNLAAMFQRTVVYYCSPPGTQSVVFSRFTPAITIECGKSEDLAGIEHAYEFLEACLHLSEIPNHPIPSSDFDLFETVARIRIPEDLTFSYANEADVEHADLVFREDLDTLNFSELPKGTSLGKIKMTQNLGLIIDDPKGTVLRGKYIDYQDGLIVTNQSIVPSMFTHNKRIVRDDCLGYIMQRVTDAKLRFTH